MKPWPVLLALSALACLSCARPEPSQAQFIFDDATMKAYLEREVSKQGPRTPIMSSDGASANTCNAYVELSSHGNLSESVNNQIVKSEYLVCDALDLISKSETYRGAVDADHMGLRLLDKLDLRTFPNSLRQLADEGPYTLKSLFPENAIAERNVARLETDDWTFTLKVIAVVQANGNAAQDWIVQLADESKTGNYRGYGTLLIYDPLDSEVLKADVYR